MIPFIVLARLSPPGGSVYVPSNTNLVFDTIISSSGTDIGYDLNTGIITFNSEGYYFIDWHVTTQTGLSNDGNNWAIQTSISNQTITGSSHTKVSVATGFAILEAAEGETARLVNVSNGGLTLSEATQSKAAIVVYRVANGS